MLDSHGVVGVGAAIDQQLLCESGIHDLLQRVSELVDDRLEIGILEVLQKVNDGFEDVDLGEQKRLAENRTGGPAEFT